MSLDSLRLSNPAECSSSMSVLQEVKYLERLHHENLVRYHHAWLENDQVSRFGPTVPTLFILVSAAACVSDIAHPVTNRWTLPTGAPLTLSFGRGKGSLRVPAHHEQAESESKTKTRGEETARRSCSANESNLRPPMASCRLSSPLRKPCTFSA